MSRPARQGHDIPHQLHDALDALEQLHHEFDRLEREHTQFRYALQAIATDHGYWGSLARAALHPKPTDRPTEDD